MNLKDLDVNRDTEVPRIRPKYVKLSYNLSSDTPQSEGFPPVTCVHSWMIEEGRIGNVFALSMASHSGTHVDAPSHVDSGGLKIADFEIDEFVFERPHVVELRRSDAELIEPEDLDREKTVIAECDLLLIRTGYHQFRQADPDRYWLRSPGLSVSSACYLRQEFKNLRAIGVDLPSVACVARIDETMRSHHALLCGEKRRFLVIEDMALEGDLSQLKQVIIAPLVVEGADSGPCTIVGTLM